MDSDRKSNVSSFYGARKSSNDVLNNDYPPQPAGYGGRTRDDASSFFSPDRSSMDHLNGPRMSSAGYNKGSFLIAGREEPLKGGRDEETQADAWDVFADFNNVGPRYSSAFSLGQSTSAGYSQLPLPTPTPMIKEESLSPAGKVEMVTVPAMGPEWAKEEMHHMTKAGKRERIQANRAHFWKEWNRGERGLCGRYFTRRVLVFSLFAICCAIAIVLAFTIPRVPSFSFNSATPLANATGAWATAVPTIFSRAPANFSFPAFASLEADTTANFLPINFNHLRATVYDLDTDNQVGSGHYNRYSLPAKGFPRFLLPLNFTYTTSNDTDQTWMNWYDACKNTALYPTGRRDPLKFRLVLEMDIQGLPTSHAASTQISDANCPIELAMNAA